MKRVLFFLLPFLSSLGVNASEAQREEIGKFRNTWYCLALESEYTDTPRNKKIYDMNDEVLAVVHEGFKRDLLIEGSGELLDGRIVNYAGKKGDEHRYRVTPNRHGDGVGSCPLEPQRIIAVDPDEIPLGSLVYIPETVGMKLPNGSAHDGYWRAEDIGSAIKKDRIDLYMGHGHRAGQALEEHGIKNLQALTVEWVDGPHSDSCVYQDPPGH